MIQSGVFLPLRSLLKYLRKISDCCLPQGIDIVKSAAKGHGSAIYCNMGPVNNYESDAEHTKLGITVLRIIGREKQPNTLVAVLMVEETIATVPTQNLFVTANIRSGRLNMILNYGVQTLLTATWRRDTRLERINRVRNSASVLLPEASIVLPGVGPKLDQWFRRFNYACSKYQGKINSSVPMIGEY